MGRYATSTSISLLLPNWLASNTTTSDTYGTDIWSAAADRAEGEVNSYLTARYDPSGWTTTAIPPLVRKLSEDLACYYSQRGSSTQDSQIKNRNLEEWKQTMETLSLLRSGDLKLAFTDGSLVGGRTDARMVSNTESRAHIFALDDERSWDVDADTLDDIDTERA